MSTIRLFFELMVCALLSILALDLLYLYYKGAWYDPWKWIEQSEIVLLYVIVLMGIIGVVIKVREYNRR